MKSFNSLSDSIDNIKKEWKLVYPEITPVEMKLILINIEINKNTSLNYIMIILKEYLM
jgi:hypothetical protein